jgi:hypothetical protein
MKSSLLFAASLLALVSGLATSLSGGSSPTGVQAAPQTLTYYLHGSDIPGVAGGFTMNATPSPAQTLQIEALRSLSWFSDPPLTGTFGPGAVFTLVVPCNAGLSLGPRYTLALTDTAGTEMRQLGQAASVLGLCFGQEQINLPVDAPLVMQGARLKLTIEVPAGLNVNLAMGSGTYLRITNFELPTPTPTPTRTATPTRTPAPALTPTPTAMPPFPTSLGLVPFVAGQPADVPPGPTVPAGTTISLRVEVTNIGQQALAQLNGTADSGFGAFSCVDSNLLPGATTNCTAIGSTGQSTGQRVVQVAFTATRQDGTTDSNFDLAYFTVQ